MEKKIGSKMSGSINIISLSAVAIDNEKGFIMLGYEFKGYSEARKKERKQKGDAL